MATYKNTPFAGMQMPMQVGTNYFNFACDISKLATSFAGFGLNDTLDLVQIPNGVMLVDFYIDTCFTDTAASVAWSIGDNVSSAHGGLGSGGWATALNLGRSSLGGVFRAGGFAQVATGAAQTSQQWVHNTIPWVYAIPYANVPVATSAISAGIWMQLKYTSAPGAAATTGIIKGWIAYSLLTSTTNADGTAPATGGYL